MISSLIALGSNKGNRIHNINKAVELIKNQIGQVVKFSRIYESHCVDIDNNIKHLENKFLNCVVKVHIPSLITPQNLLHKLKEIEKKIGRKDKQYHHQEREIDLDILFYGDRKIDTEELTIPHPQIRKRDFVLKPLCDIDKSMVVQNNTIKDLICQLENSTKQKNQVSSIYPIIPCAREIIPLNKPIKMLIINCTNDSFSEKGLLKDFTLEEYKRIENNLMDIDSKYSIDILDIGGESTRPNAKVIDEETELHRVSQLIDIIRRNPYLKNKIISLDTRKAIVVKKLEQEVDIINDVSGSRFDPEMRNVISNINKPYIYVHSRGDPTNMLNVENTTYSNCLDEVINESRKDINNLISSGFNGWNIIFDPGLGFAKNENDNFRLLTGIKQMKDKLPFPLLIGASKKRFMGDLRFNNTANNIITAMSFYNGADIIRLHDYDEAVKVSIEMGYKLGKFH